MSSLLARARATSRQAVATRVAIVAFFGQLYFFVPVMTPYLQLKGLSLAQIAGMQTTLMLSMMALEIPTGVLADRVGHRRSYQISLAMAALGELLTLLAGSYPAFLLAQIVSGTGFAFGSGSMDAYLYDSLPATNRTAAMQRARGLVGAALQAASLVAYGVSALITRQLTSTQMRITLWLDVIFVTLAALLAFLILHEPAREAAAVRPSSLALFRAGWHAVRANPALQRLVLLSTFTNAFSAHLLIFYQAYFLQAGVRPIWLGAGLAAASGLAIFTQLHAWRLAAWIGNRRAVILAAGIPGLLYLLMAATAHAPVLAVTLFIIQWAAIQLITPLMSGLSNAVIPEEARATTLSLINGIATMYVAIGGVALGWLGERSVSLTFLVPGVIICVMTALLRPPAVSSA